MSETTQGNVVPETTQASDAPNKPQETQQKFLTAEEFNRAFSAREKAAEKKQQEALSRLQESLLGSVSGKLEEILSTRLATSVSQETPSAIGEPTRPPSIEDTPQFKAMQGQLAKMQDQLRKEGELRAQTEAKARDAALRQRIAETASSFGVDPKRAKILVGHLVDAEKRAKWGDDGNVVLAQDDGDTDIRSGLEQFFKSDEGKLFLPPTGAAGSGDRPSGGGLPVSRNTTREQLAAMLVGHLAGR